ncbi:MAG: acyltransferase family protein [Alphaproteobacteria bacterium]|nr:acyltransferase family protein [Alphaproteobacteria bacterium]
MTTPSYYRPDIDGLRAVAVLVVLAFHLDSHLLPGGFVGVDVFFVISGYLITGLILRAQQAHVFNIADFYFRRARRILPSLTVVLLFCLVAGWFMLMPDEFASLRKHIVAGSLFYANILNWLEVGYFDAPAQLKPLLHLWSLGVEEQFYLIWPFILWLCMKMRGDIKIFIAAAMVVSFLVAIILGDGSRDTAFYLLPSRLWELAAGGALVVMEMRTKGAGKPRLSPWIKSTVGMVLILGACIGLDKTDYSPGWQALLPVLGTVLIIAAGPQAPFNRLVLSNSAMVFVGLISYPLYLWHWPLLSYAHIVQMGAPSGLLLVLCLAAAFPPACLTYFFIERPIRARPVGSVITPFGLRLFLGIVAALFLTISATLIVKYPAARAVPAVPGAKGAEMALNNFFIARSTNNNCTAILPTVDPRWDYCNMSVKDLKDVRLAIVGDSHAHALWQTFDGYYRRKTGKGTINLGVGNTILPNRLNDSQPSTMKINNRMQAIIDLITTTDTIKTVLLVGRWTLQTKSESEAAILHDRLDAEVTLLEKLGKKVVLVLQPPELSYNPLLCEGGKQSGRPMLLEDTPPVSCVTDREKAMAPTKPMRAIARDLKARYPDLIVIDSAQSVCNETTCTSLSDEGVSLYRDKDHLSVAGTILVTKRLLQLKAVR